MLSSTYSLSYPQSSYLFLKVCLYHLPRSPHSAAKGSQLTLGTSLSFQGHYTTSLPQVLFLSPRRHKHAQDLEQRWPPHATTNPLDLHSSAGSHLASYLQHPKPSRWSNWGYKSTEVALFWYLRSRFGNYLWKGITHNWHKNSGCTTRCFPSQLLAVNSCMKGGKRQRRGQAARPSCPSYTSRHLARACHTSSACTQRYFT